MRITGLLFGLAAITLSSQLWAATYYVAPTGSDTAAGTLAAPFASWAKAQSVVAAGDTVYFRGGTYAYTTATATCGGNTGASVASIVLTVSGTAAAPINYFAYTGEKPVFDFSGVTDMNNYNCRHIGVNVKANYLHVKGLEFTGVLQLNNLNHESWCFYLTGGSNNTFEQLDAHHNMGPGFFIQQGGNNTFLNCDSHENEDTLTSNGDGQSADGFGCHPTTGTNNVFTGCRAWWNSDDGWDFINTPGLCTVENSWAWLQGYKPDAITGGQPVALAAGNGNGFKGGGYGMPPANVPATPPQHIIRQNLSVYNKAAGFYANHSPVNAYFYNNTGYHNNPDFNMLGVAADGATSISVGILRNNLAYAGTLTSNINLGGASTIDDQYNSWDSNMNLTVSAAYFQNTTFPLPASCPEAYTPGGTPCVDPTDMTTFAGLASARQADGSLPVLTFMHLAANSPAIDKGIDIGLPYNGAAPDLGCFESGGAVADAGTDTGPVDTGVADTGVVDTGTGVADTGVADTHEAAVDTGVADTATGVADSGTDSGAADTAVVDTGTGGADTGTGGADTTTSGADTNVTDTHVSVADTSNAADTGTGTANSQNGCGCHVGATGVDPSSIPFAMAGLLALLRRRRRS